MFECFIKLISHYFVRCHRHIGYSVSAPVKISVETEERLKE